MSTSPNASIVNLRHRFWRTMVIALLTAGTAAHSFGQLVLTRQFTVNQAIPDAGDLLNLQTLDLTDTDILELRVTLDIERRSGPGFNGDLYVALGHGDGYSVLINRPGKTALDDVGYADGDGFNVTFADAAAGDVHNYRLVLAGNANSALTGALTGIWQPDGRNVDPNDVLDASARTAMLSSFNGLPANGQWRLLVSDVSAGGLSRLKGWGVSIKTTGLPGGLVGDVLEFLGAGTTFNNALAVTGNSTITGSHGAVFSGEITGTGGLIQSGTGTLVLSGENTFSGGVDVRSGTVSIGHDSALGGGELRVAGGSLSAEGGGRTLANEVRFQSGASFTGSNPITFNNTATLESSTQLTVNNRTVFNAPVNEETVGSRLTVTGSGTLVLGAGGNYTGGTLVSGGRLFVNNTEGSATGTGAVEVRDGGILGGNGTIAGSLTISNGGVISPGTSPGRTTTGSQVWGAAGNYEWEINSARTTLGIGKGADPGYDWLDISSGDNPTLTIDATALNPFTVKLVGLADSLNQGAVSGFNNQQSYTWILATATGGIVGFDPDELQIDATAFVNNNSLGGGSFSLGVNGNDLRLQFVPVPEPSAIAAATGALLLLGAVVRRLWRAR